MNINLYIYFPDTDDQLIAINESSDGLKGIVQEVFLIKRNLKKAHSFHIYYDSENLSKFLGIASALLPENYLTGIKNEIMYALRFVSTNANIPINRDINSIYANWFINISVESSPAIISECSESAASDTEKSKTFCLLLGNSINTNRDEIHVIKDLHTNSDLPNIVGISSSSNATGFIRWFITIPNGKFKLKSNPLYEALDKFWKKERIYREIATGNHCYFDFFHRENKVHYEVFNDTGEIHLGEMDEDGNLKPNTADNRKKISNIL